MIVLIAGPSGIGKTTVLKELTPRFPDASFVSLDDVTAEMALQRSLIGRSSISLLYRTIADPDKFLDLGLEALRLHVDRNSYNHLVVDVGAGFQISKNALSCFHEFKVVALLAEPSVALARIRTRNPMQKKHFMDQEFSQQRRLLYSSAHAEVQTAYKSIQMTCDEVSAILSGWFDQSDQQQG